MRFYWKQQSVSAGTDAGKAKILRKVQYPRVLDIYEFCSDALKKHLDVGREVERKVREAEDEKRLAGLAAQDEKANEKKSGEDVEMKDANAEEIKE